MTHAPKFGGLLKKGHLDPGDPTFPIAANQPAPFADLRPWCPEAYLQFGNECIPHTNVGIARYLLKRDGHPDQFLSRLQNYWDMRNIEGTTSTDSGGYIRDGIKAWAKLGIGLEAQWPYDQSQVLVKPSHAVYQSAKPYQAVAYSALVLGPTPADSLRNLKAAIALGHVVSVGWWVYTNANAGGNGNGGLVDAPGPSDKIIGLHNSYFHSYGIKTNAAGNGTIGTRSSWGPMAGDGNGDYFLDEVWLSQTMFDAWVVTKLG